MFCENPKIVKNPKYLDDLNAKFSNKVGCGKCFMCRIKRRKEWSSRCTLEAIYHEQSSVHTLTYNDENLPPTLNKRDLELFRKSLKDYVRYYKLPFKVRFFACGEYGANYDRPHYHIIIFGLPITYSYLVEKAWKNKGFIYSDTLTPESIRYVAGYVGKKLLEENGRDEGFLCMSTVPAIGTEFINQLIQRVENNEVKLEEIDLNFVMLSNGKTLNIGKVLRKKFRAHFDLPPIEYEEKLDILYNCLKGKKYNKEENRIYYDMIDTELRAKKLYIRNCKSDYLNKIKNHKL